MKRLHQRPTVHISNPEKVLFPRDGITKAGLAAYYEEIADTMLPHVRDRAVVMHRFPDGIRCEGFIQKDVPEYFPEWIKTVLVKKAGGSLTHVSQYNVLRTLRHAGSEGLTCGEVSERLSTRDSDITRLLDRLELLGLIARRRDRPDRRIVRTKITEEGTGVLNAIDTLIGELQVRHLGHLGPKRLSAFGALLKSAAITGLVE
jgi:DNA-binding MarR family transcriptional regulator